MANGIRERFDPIAFPLIKFFVFTKEKLNPWRCQVCATQKQTKEAKNLETEDNPIICNKCGLFW